MNELIHSFVSQLIPSLHSFATNPQVPAELRSELSHPTRISFDASSENAVELRGSTQLNPKRVQFLFKRFSKDRLLHFPSFPFTVKVPEWATALEEGIRRAHYRQLECQR